jgi:transposase
VISDAQGTPLLVHTTAANVRDDLPAVEMVKSLPAVKQPRGRPRRKPRQLLGDRGYGFPWIIAAIVLMGIVSLLCPRGSPHGSGLGKRRYVIERTLSWLGNFRRLKLCYERTGEHFQAFHELAACVLCAAKLADDG